jgi:hypothetical protein
MKVIKVLGTVEGDCCKCSGRAVQMLPCPVAPDGRIMEPDHWPRVTCAACRTMEDCRIMREAKVKANQRKWLRLAEEKAKPTRAGGKA